MNGASFWLKKLALIQTKSITLSKVGGMPLARLRLRLPTREGEVTNLNQRGKTLKPLIPQFPLAEPASTLIPTK